MIIACPDCSGPYQLPDDQIAPLVQVECPHCTYRIILDFAAANDASLVEQGMRMASGYASEADYRAAAGGQVAARATPAAAAPRPTPPPTPPAARPGGGPIRSPVPEGARPPATAESDGAEADTGRTILGQPPISIPPAPPEHRAKTPAPLELTQRVAEQQAAAEPDEPVVELTRRATPPEVELDEAAEVEEAFDEEEEIEAEVGEAAEFSEAEEDAAEIAPEEARRPPHTPPAKAASTPPPASEEDLEAAEGPSPAELSAAGMSSSELEALPKSQATLYFLIGLLLIGGVLVGFSFYETGDLDPMPLIEELIRSYTG